MLHCLNSSGNLGGSCSDITVLERQRERRKCQQQEQHQQEEEQEHQGLFCGTGYDDVFCSSSSSSSSLQVQNPQGLMMMMMMMMMDGGDSTLVGDELVVLHSVKPDPGLENGFPEMGKLDNSMAFGSASSSGFDHVSSSISRTCSSPRGRNSLVSPTEKRMTESFKKRKAENPKVVAAAEESDNKDKRFKVSSGEEESSKVTEQNSNNNNRNVKPSTSRSNKEASADTTKENSKGSEVQNQKPDYIHVRARRGQATDTHSLAERVRREKISERMKYLQDLVPGCNKITGKAGMLDEIINYVQSLQRQVEFLSMKLAAVNPRLDFNIDDLLAKEVFPPCAPSFPTIGMPSEMTNPAYLEFNSAQQLVSSCGGLINNIGMNPSDMGLRKTISAPVSLPETFLDSSSCFTQILPSSTWEGDFQIQNLYNVAFDQARTSSFPSQPFTGLVEASNLKMEM